MQLHFALLVNLHHAVGKFWRVFLEAIASANSQQGAQASTSRISSASSTADIRLASSSLSLRMASPTRTPRLGRNLDKASRGMSRPFNDG